MVAIKFENYIVNNIDYTRNDEYENEEGNIAIDPNFSAKIYYANTRAVVEINVEINKNQDNAPFALEVTISGFFELDDVKFEKNDNMSEFKQMLSSNALAIIYPYVRNMVSDITLKSNEFPALTLPVMNFVNLVQKEGKVEFIDMSGDME